MQQEKADRSAQAVRFAVMESRLDQIERSFRMLERVLTELCPQLPARNDALSYLSMSRRSAGESLRVVAGPPLTIIPPSPKMPRVVT